jgi:alpha-glucosidase
MMKVGAPCTWALSNHDTSRPVTRYGGEAIGLARARAAAVLKLALPGTVYLYNGEELGLPNVDDLPESALQDPTWEHSGHTVRGRDGERIPLPWSGPTPPFGFTSGTSTWLPMPASWASLTVEAQQADPESTLTLYRRALKVRATMSDLCNGSFDWIDAPDGNLAFRRGSACMVAVNFTDTPAPLPPGKVILASAPVGEDGLLPANTGVWMRLAS